MLDLFQRWGYELVITPHVEFLESLLTGSGQDLDLRTFKVIDPAGAKVYKFWEDLGGSEEVAHLAQGTSVEVTATRGNQVRILAPNVGCVFRASLEPIASVPVASAPTENDAPTHRYGTRGRAARTRLKTPLQPRIRPQPAYIRPL